MRTRVANTRRFRTLVVSAVIVLSTILVSTSITGLSSNTPPRTASQGPPINAPFSNVVVIMMENRNYGDVIGNPSAPYLSQLANTYGNAANYHEVSQYGSLPEYLAIVSGNSYDNAWSRCNTPPSKCTGMNPNGVSDQTVIQTMENAGLSWKAYMEDMPSNCDRQDSGRYMVIHNPFVYFSHITSNPSECARVIPAGVGDSALLSDLGSTIAAPNFMWLTPNDCNDMWGCPTSTGDSYLSMLVPKILNSPVFQTQKAALFITWDEGSTMSHIPAIWAGPAVKQHYTSTVNYTHYSALKTIETAWTLPTLTGNDAGATSMTEFFSSTPNRTPGYTITPNPTNLRITDGSNATSTITLTSTNGFSGTVTLSTSLTPTTLNGPGISLSPTSVTLTPGQSSSSTLTVKTSSSTPTGNYAVTITGTSGSTSQQTTISLNILPAGSPPDFGLSAIPESLTVPLGSSGTSSVMLTSLNGFSNAVYLTASVSSSGISLTPPTASLGSSIIQLTPSGTSSTTLTVSTSLLTTPGTYTVTITATSGTLSHTVTITVNVDIPLTV